MTSDNTPDLWGRTPADYEASANGNAMILGARAAAASRARPVTDLTQPTRAQGDALRDRLASATTEAEAARRSGDAERVAYAEFQLDQLIEASRGSRAAAERARDEAGQFAPAPSFDGGVRLSGPDRGKNRHLRREENPNALFAQAIQAAHAKAQVESEGLKRVNGVVIANS